MARFFFDIDDGALPDRDQEGSVLSGLDAARREALACLTTIAGDKFPRGGDRQCISVDIRNEAGETVYTARLSLDAKRLA